MSSERGGGLKGGSMKMKFQMLQSREDTCAPFPFYVTEHICVCIALHSVKYSDTILILFCLVYWRMQNLSVVSSTFIRVYRIW